MRLIPETGFGQARVGALLGATLLGVGVYAIDRLDPEPLINPGERNAQVASCLQDLPRLGHLATQTQIDGTPCKQFLGQFGHDEVVTTYYEPGTNSSDYTGAQTSDTIKYVLPGAQNFRKANFITPAHAKSLEEQAKHQGRQALGDAFVMGGGLGTVEMLAIGALQLGDDRIRRRTSPQVAVR